MRIAIAGGNGFIGRQLTRILLDSGHDIVWLSHRPGKAEALGFAPDVREVVFEYHDDTGPWVDEVAASDAIVNLSGYPISSRWTARTLHLIRESRIDTTRSLVRAALDARERGTGPTTYVSASGIGIYGERGEEVLHESARPGDDRLAQLAVEWESASLPAEEAGMRRVLMRNGVVLGDEGFLPRILPPMRMFVGGPVGSGRQWFPWIHVTDAASAYAHALATPELGGPVNVVAPEQLRMREFMRVLGHVVHRPSWLPVPVTGLRLILGPVAPYMVFSQRATPAQLHESGYRWRMPELKDALFELVRKG